MVRALDIVEVVQRAGIPASTLRYYEEKGLIVSVGRRGLRRLFGEQVLEQLALIGLGRAAGLSLDEIGLMFAPDGQPRIGRHVLAAKADELDQTIRKLSAMARRAAACCRLSRAESHGMPDLPSPAARCRIRGHRQAREESHATPLKSTRDKKA